MTQPPIEPQTLRVKPPSESRQEATDSVVYRLSELMFGSLLAAYVLGFIGFAASAAQLATTSGDLSAFYPEGVTYLCISTTFAYLTAGLYISYHVSILTMPHLPLSRLRWDFLVALLQAAFFGLAMLSPPWFPLCLGSVLVAAAARQYWEHRALADWFHGILPLSREEPSPSSHAREKLVVEKQRKRVFRNTFKAVLQEPEVEELTIWRPIPKSIWGAAFLLIGGGLLVFFRRQSLGDQSAEPLMREVTTWTAIAISILTIILVNSLLKERADFLYSEEAISSLDSKFYHFYDLLKKRAKTSVRQNQDSP